MNERKELLAAGICPHAWRKMKQAERNMLRSLKGRGNWTTRRWQRGKKWAREMWKWAHRIFPEWRRDEPAD